MKLQAPTGWHCKLDIEKVIPRQKGRKKSGAWLPLPTVLMIPADCPHIEWVKRHVTEVLTKLKMPRSNFNAEFSAQLPMLDGVAQMFAKRAATAPKPAVNYRGALTKGLNNSQRASPAAPNRRQRKSASDSSGSIPLHARKSPPTATAQQSLPPLPQVDALTAKLQAMAAEQKQLKESATSMSAQVMAPDTNLKSLTSKVDKQTNDIAATQTNVTQVTGMLTDSLETQKAFKTSLATLTGLTATMFKVLRDANPKQRTLTACEPLVAAMVENLQQSSTTSTAVEGLIVEPTEEIRDDLTTATAFTEQTAATDEDEFETVGQDLDNDEAMKLIAEMEAEYQRRQTLSSQSSAMELDTATETLPAAITPAASTTKATLSGEDSPRDDDDDPDNPWRTVENKRLSPRRLHLSMPPRQDRQARLRETRSPGHNQQAERNKSQKKSKRNEESDPIPDPDDSLL